MIIRYIHHSCFLIETENSFLIFDYYKHRDNGDFSFTKLLEKIFSSPKNLYLLSSHSHSDHFNYDILSWIERKPNTYYILSSDIKLYKDAENVYTVREGDSLTVKDLSLDIFGSTDEGVSFMVNTDGLNIFHAGDLHWWKWKEDSPSEEKAMEESFKKIIDDIKKFGKEIVFAFFPVDRRLEENYHCGGEYFIQELNPSVFIPMHFWNDFSVTKDFKEAMKNYNSKIIEITHPNQILSID